MVTFCAILCFQASARTQVSVTLPPKLELHCPELVVANKSLDVTLVSWGGVGLDVEWTITKDGIQVAKGKTLKLCAAIGVELRGFSLFNTFYLFLLD